MSFESFIGDVWQDPAVKGFALKKVQKQISQIFLELNHTPKNILNFGYKNAASILLDSNNAYDTELDYSKQYDTVLALDEYFTYAPDEQSQKQMIEDAARLVKPGGILLASMRDYRNNPVHKRNLGDSSYININNTHYVVVEINRPDMRDNQLWHQTNFVIEGDSAAVAYELGERRTLYFKQLAKYCNDANCRQFGVLKEYFWKSPWKRNAEHIAWARF
jgi:hypothetical protein